MSSNHNFPLFVIGTHWLPHIFLANAQDKNKNKIFVKNIKTKILGTL
jgi:hypothetical protein